MWPIAFTVSSQPRNRRGTYLAPDSIELFKANLAFGQRAQPDLVELWVVDGHDGLYTIPMLGFRANTEATIIRGCSDVFVNHAKTVSGRELLWVELSIIGGEARSIETIEEVGMSAGTIREEDDDK